MLEEEKEQKEEKQLVTVGQLAYCKIVYHLIRYPTAKVTGALVGPNPRTVTDAYPLFHSPLVNPTLSLALDLVESNLPAGQLIVGFYEFAEGAEIKINALIENNPAMKNMVAMKVWMNAERQIKTGAARFQFDCPSFSSLEEGLKRGEYRFIVDMDAHLEEVELDFRNGYLSN